MTKRVPLNAIAKTVQSMIDESESIRIYAQQLFDKADDNDIVVESLLPLAEWGDEIVEPTFTVETAPDSAV